MDRVSNLPDELISHILSFLPTKQAAVTRGGSIYGNSFLISTLTTLFSFIRKKVKQKGAKFDRASLNSWTEYSLCKRGVIDLDLLEDSYFLPKELFTSKTLVNLKLRIEHCVDWWWGSLVNHGAGSSLPKLKSLNIDSALILCDHIEEFVPSFPVLEELRMTIMEWRVFDVKISSSSLKKLSLHGTGCAISNKFKNPKTFSFDTPNLVFLNYSELVAEDYPLVKMEKLSEARITLIVTDNQMKRVRSPEIDLLEGEDDDDRNVVLKFGNVVKLMNGIRNVTKLSLESDTLEVISLCSESMPVFNNLKFLGVTSEEGRGWQAMPVLLRHFPHLETIIIKGLLHYVTDKCGDACPCISREDKGRSLASCPVNRLEIQRFRGTMKEMNMIKHFLDYFPGLKRLDVYVEENDPARLTNTEVSDLVVEMFGLYNELFPSCDVQLLVFLDKKWTEQGYI